MSGPSVLPGNFYALVRPPMSTTPRDVYLEAVNPSTVQDWFSDIWGLTLGGGVQAGLRPRAGDTVVFSGTRCNVRLTADSPFIARINHDAWGAVPSNEGLLFIDDGCTLKVGDGTNAIVNTTASPGSGKGMYLQNKSTSGTVGTGAVEFAGGFDLGTGACVANSIRLLNSGTCDYISPEGTNPCTLTIDPGVTWQNDLKDQILGNAPAGTNNITQIVLGTGSIVRGSQPFSFTFDGSITGSGAWTVRTNLSHATQFDITGHTGDFSPSIMELGGTASALIFSSGKDLSGIGQFSVLGTCEWSPLHNFTAKLFAISGSGRLNLNTHNVTVTMTTNAVVLQGSKTSGAGAAVLNSIANPILLSGTGVQQIRGTSNLANTNYWGHLDQTTAGGQVYLRDGNPSFSSCKVTGTLRVSPATVPDFGGDLTMRSGAAFFNSGSWSGMGFKCNNLTLNGQSLSNATLTIRGTGVATGGTFTNVNCGAGNTLTVTGGTNGGGNTNINFV